ncbi:hypothetical protein Poli38472_011025 [Pythium oligandrum]|uniref:Elicitin-like protein n=1 Tax=Pythium oligandrum TaxID=41045 RepID=A0A8K1CQ08_PYTOL|nr:hypothetical protein Poli38472_011025 [Pythium oligandrum]|eukprot:TMW67405.1 hypothetical protein Poli38472_011025 [Pythium oligandrum]
MRVLALSLAVVAAALSTVQVDAASACNATENAALDTLIEPLKGLLAACKADTGYVMYPFTAYPANESQQIHVCSGRSCPTVYGKLLEDDKDKLPDCLVTIGSTPMTVTKFLGSICDKRPDTPVPSPTNTTSPAPTPTTATPKPKPSTTIPTPSSSKKPVASGSTSSSLEADSKSSGSSEEKDPEESSSSQDTDIDVTIPGEQSEPPSNPDVPLPSAATTVYVASMVAAVAGVAALTQ